MRGLWIDAMRHVKSEEVSVRVLDRDREIERGGTPPRACEGVFVRACEVVLGERAPERPPERLATVGAMAK